LLHLLGEVLGAAPQCFQRPALRAHGTIGITIAKLAFGLPHRLAGIAELVAGAALTLLPLLPLLILPEALLSQLLPAFAGNYRRYVHCPHRLLQTSD
jgi:hypothetical protein